MTGLVIEGDALDALIHKSNRRERSVPIYLGVGAMLADYEEMDEQLKALASRPQDDRLTGVNVETKRLAERMTAMREEMVDSRVMFRFRGMPPGKFIRLMEEHPPRKEDDGTINVRDMIGVNSATFPGPLIRACIISPKLTDEQWQILFDPTAEQEAEGLGLSHAQYDSLFSAAWSVNRAEVDIPFLSTALRSLQRPAKESKRPSV